MIPTQTNYVEPISENLLANLPHELGDLKPIKPFHPLVMELFANLSERLLKAHKRFPDLVGFAFWIRRGNLVKMKESLDCSLRKGRGIVFHITPSNIPLNFAYSMATGLLMGNINIVRLPNRYFEQASLLISELTSILQEQNFNPIENYVRFIQYGRNKTITDALSRAADVRIIWGGDTSIDEIRKSPLRSSGYDVVFSDRYSIALIDAAFYLKSSEKDSVAEGFFNDTFLFDQNACTSPKTVFWFGEDQVLADAKLEFWQRLERLTKERYSIQASQIMDKFVAENKAAILTNGQTKKVMGQSNLINRIELGGVITNLSSLSTNGGLFFEYQLKTLNELSKFTDRKFQTISYYGFSKEALTEFINQNDFFGIDRLVPIGRTMDFSLNWDGYELSHALTKKIQVL